MVKYEDVVEAANRLGTAGIGVTHERIAELLQIDPASIEESVAWERYLIYNEEDMQ
ncbi:MAG: hypothetical protein ISN29_11465 [Gammaproteobacteria bacterium AqS3]|nr:hypothetical protein [Gammaproteobacteria bacterium AqS3]